MRRKEHNLPKLQNVIKNMLTISKKQIKFHYENK